MSMFATALACRQGLWIHWTREWGGGVRLLVSLSFLGSLLDLIDAKLIPFCSAFFHKKSFDGYNEPFVGQAVSFVLEEGPKGAAATKVKEEEGGVAIEGAAVEDEGEREMGTVKVRLTATYLCLTQFHLLYVMLF